MERKKKNKPRGDKPIRRPQDNPRLPLNKFNPVTKPIDFGMGIPLKGAPKMPNIPQHNQFKPPQLGGNLPQSIPPGGIRPPNMQPSFKAPPSFNPMGGPSNISGLKNNNFVPGKGMIPPPPGSMGRSPIPPPTSQIPPPPGLILPPGQMIAKPQPPQPPKE